MPDKTPQAPRGDWVLENTPDGARIVIPTRPVWFVALFLLLWLGGWFAGETFALRSLFGDAPLAAKVFLVVWLAGWTAGGFAAGTAFLFVSGLAREVVWRDGPDLCLRWEVFGAGWTRRFPASGIGPLAVPAAPSPSAGPAVSGGKMAIGGSHEPLRPDVVSKTSGALWKAGDRTEGIRFSSGGKEVSIGAGLDAGQAVRLADILVSRFGLRRAD